MNEYDYMECCASGSCEVCGGLQGIIRASVRKTVSRNNQPTADRICHVCTGKGETCGTDCWECDTTGVVGDTRA